MLSSCICSFQRHESLDKQLVISEGSLECTTTWDTKGLQIGLMETAGWGVMVGQESVQLKPSAQECLREQKQGQPSLFQAQISELTDIFW